MLTASASNGYYLRRTGTTSAVPLRDPREQAFCLGGVRLKPREGVNLHNAVETDLEVEVGTSRSTRGANESNKLARRDNVADLQAAGAFLHVRVHAGDLLAVDDVIDKDVVNEAPR